MRSKIMPRTPEWLGTRTINCYISLSEVAGQIINGKLLPNKEASQASTEFASRIAELIHDYGGVATIIDAYSVAAHWRTIENDSNTFDQAVRLGMELKKLTESPSNGSQGRRKMAAVISSAVENTSLGSNAHSGLLELSKDCLIKSYGLILTEQIYEQVQKSVKAYRIGLVQSNSRSGLGVPIYLFEEMIVPSVRLQFEGSIETYSAGT